MVGISFRYTRYKTSRLDSIAKIFGTTIRLAYSPNPTPKKSADTMFTRLLTTSGVDAVSAMKPQAMMNGRIILSLILRARTMARTIVVRISADPSFAKNYYTTDTRSVM